MADLIFDYIALAILLTIPVVCLVKLLTGVAWDDFFSFGNGRAGRWADRILIVLIILPALLHFVVRDIRPAGVSLIDWGMALFTAAFWIRTAQIIRRSWKTRSGHP